MRFVSRCPGAAVVLPLVAILSCATAQAEGNIVPVKVHLLASGEGNNHLFVDVTVCNAEKQCQTVPDVLVDTGSSGLRLFRPALQGLDLRAVTVRDDRPVGVGEHFGAGDLWGKLHWARVRIGGLETSQEITIEVHDAPSPGESVPAGYGDRDMRVCPAMGNGILGIAAERYSPGRYFAAAGGTGPLAQSDWNPVKLDKSRRLSNPIIHFPDPYNNGSVISLPEVDASNGQKTVQGWLGFGIGEPTAMLYPQGSRVITHELDQASRFPVKLGERSFDVLLDSGGSGVILDLDHLGIAHDKCFPGLYSPAALMPLHFTVTSAGHEIKLARALPIGPGAKMLKAIEMGYAVLPTLAPRPDEVRAKEGELGPGTLGLPFFYGRTVATGLQGSVNPFAARMPEAASTTLHEEGQERVTHSANGFVAYTD